MNEPILRFMENVNHGGKRRENREMLEILTLSIHGCMVAQTHYHLMRGKIVNVTRCCLVVVFSTHHSVRRLEVL